MRPDDACSIQRRQVLAQEDECDGCVRCGQGGYQHYLLTLTDRKRRLRGVARVVRTGGDALTLAPRDAANAYFEAETIFAEEAVVEPILRRYFPALLRVAKIASDQPANGIVLNSGTMHLDQLIMTGF